MVGPWLGELIFDIVVFGMTLYKTLTLPRGGGIGLLSTIIRDGTDLPSLPKTAAVMLMSVFIGTLYFG